MLHLLVTPGSKVTWYIYTILLIKDTTFLESKFKKKWHNLLRIKIKKKMNTFYLSRKYLKSATLTEGDQAKCVTHLIIHSKNLMNTEHLFNY